MKITTLLFAVCGVLGCGSSEVSSPDRHEKSSTVDASVVLHVDGEQHGTDGGADSGFVSVMDGGGSAVQGSSRDAGPAAPDAEVRCIGTWDSPESIARTICSNRDCRVCVQSVDRAGAPLAWVALEPGSRCACPTPTQPIVSSDAGA